MVEPQTPAEWQEAVDAADGCLHLDAARGYGLVTGGPEVDVRRCEWILAAGAALGYVPAANAVERFTRELLHRSAA